MEDASSVILFILRYRLRWAGSNFGGCGAGDDNDDADDDYDDAGNFDDDGEQRRHGEVD